MLRLERVQLHLHCPICLHGMVLNYTPGQIYLLHFTSILQKTLPKLELILLHILRREQNQFTNSWMTYI
jgi:hypothetical protein